MLVLHGRSGTRQPGRAVHPDHGCSWSRSAPDHAADALAHASGGCAQLNQLQAGLLVEIRQRQRRLVEDLRLVSHQREQSIIRLCWQIARLTADMRGSPGFAGIVVEMKV
jgi:hypothetical protein